MVVMVVMEQQVQLMALQLVEPVEVLDPQHLVVLSLEQRQDMEIFQVPELEILQTMVIVELLIQELEVRQDKVVTHRVDLEDQV
jgi:hypothetical protein